MTFMKTLIFIVPADTLDDAVRLFADDYSLFRVETYTENGITYNRVEMHKKGQHVAI
jgi:hypothetical protein